MRTFLRQLARPLMPLVSATALLAPLGTSDLAAALPTSTRAVLRDGRPWMVLGARAGASTSKDARVRARLELAAASESAARLSPSLRVTGVERFGDGDVVVRFEQAHEGLPVVGRGAAVRLGSRADRGIALVDLEETLPATTTPAIDATTAARSASRFTALGARAEDAHLVVWPARGGARLAWAVLPRVPAGLPTRPRVIVDALDGEVLEARDLVSFARAAVHATNPLRSPAIELLELPVPPDGATLSSGVLQSSNCVDNKTVRPVDMFGFKQNMHVCDLLQVATADDNGDFIYPPSDVPGSAEAKDDPYSEVSIYFHAAKAYAYFRGLQGDAEAQVTFDKPLRVVANLQLPPGLSSGSFAEAGDADRPLEPFSNAFFSPASGGLGDLFAQLYGFEGGGLFFGQGPERDYAYDGDVVYHELVHAVVDHTLKLGGWTVDAQGAIDAPGAMNEGLADYFSSAIAGDADVGEYASKDLGSEQSVIRTLDNRDACPTALVGEVHVDSTVFSGALWDARRALAGEEDRARFDAALYKAMRTSAPRSDLGFEDAAKLMLATLSIDLPAGAAALEHAMTARGLLPGCARVLTWKGDPLVSAAPRLGFAAPSSPTLGVKGTAPGILQVRVPLPAGAEKITFSMVSRGGGDGGFGGRGRPFKPSVLVKWGSAIQWTAGRTMTNDSDAQLSPSETGDRVAATFTVPEGASEAFFQIANAGDQDGSYDAIAIEAVPAETAAPGVEPPAPPVPADALPSESSGCGCSTPGTSAGAPAAALAALSVLSAAARRRRRR